jgi:protein O-GlcNAc transferase
MRGKEKILCLAFLICPLLLGGCNSQKSKASKVDEIKKTPAELKKASLLKTLDRKFENPDAHFELGQLYHADGMWAKAQYHYNIALSFAPVHRPAQAAMVKALLDSGDTTKAKITADIYINQVSNSATESLKLGLAFQKQLLDDFALSCYQQALHLAPNSAKIHRQIGYYYLSKKDRVRATEYLSRSFQLDPRQAEVAGELGRLGVQVRIPQKTQKNTKKLDKIVEQSDKKK